MALVLGIETSCDETAAAVVDEDFRVLSSVVESSIDQHRAFGGVVPELAGRAHVTTIGPVIRRALDDAGLDPRDPAIDGLAVTSGPGLIGSLLVGLSTTKALSLAWGIPFVGVNHLEGHLFAPLLESKDLEWPLMTLLVSGGHSLIVLQRGPGHHDVLGETIDDAAGEAYDKVARWLGLGYPGGPEIDRLAKAGVSSALKLPVSMVGDDFDLSFSGLKTAVVRATEAHREISLEDVAASFQSALCEQLLRKLRHALERYEVRGVALAGGVAANSALRDGVTQLAKEFGLVAHLPTMAMCTDNAAMVAAAGLYRLSTGVPSALDLSARPNWQLAEVS
ncbi:MAG TPA: tRNA (adenosine(37)-N6)-threonylcarbamoyltransferase complex transferase subunit TsaD [Acidimicrobiales bacterium]|jgi:N6-L-threonylcarbamoyladenine synthase|nr:tRNA (adenosine(37)-N6)-threonylcarbamoyltransferase complex transferase subunit TsaD [Acidimicrobiales bacterium]